MALPAPFKEIPEADGVTMTWNGRVYAVSMTEVVVTSARGKTYTLDRLFKLHDKVTGKVIWMTGDAYDKVVKIRAAAAAKGR